jgi:ribosomal protein S18 acetylase RimI-like enzyme
MQELITLRPVSGHDESFLFHVFRYLHEPSFASLQIPAEQKTGLLQMQFNAQQSQYCAQYPDADFDIVLRDGEPVGYMYALRGPDAYVLIDISLLPEQRNKGVGARLVSALIKEAQSSNEPLEAHVLRDNPAWRLWQRLGFEQVGDDGVHLQIRVPFEREQHR